MWSNSYTCPECNTIQEVDIVIEEGIDTEDKPFRKVLLRCGHESKFTRITRQVAIDSLFQKKVHYLKKIKECVAFIFVKEGDEYQAIGTGFFIGIKQESTSIYFVTAKHVLLPNGNLYPEIYIRLNRKSSNPEYKELNLAKDNILMHPEDENVDIALFPFSPQVDIYDFLYISAEELLATKDIADKKMVEGDQVFFAGLFEDHPGRGRNYPILRFGKVSLLMDEKIEVNAYNEQEKWAHVYLFEIQSSGNNSGSPVFFEVPRARRDERESQSGHVEIYLIGVLKGHYYDLRFPNVWKTSGKIRLELNMGIAMVTPSYLLQEILFSKKAKKQRGE